MATVVPDVSIGFLLSFTGSTVPGGTFSILDVTPPTSEGVTIESSHQGTVDDMTFIPGKLRDNGELVLLVQHDQDYNYYADINKDSLAGGVTLTTPNGATHVFRGIFLRYAPQTATLGEKMVADLTIKVSGAVVVTPG